MNISGGGGTWAAAEKEKNINAIQGLLKPCFRPKQGADPAFASWVTQLENLLTQSYTEQNLYDFKQGFCTLEAKPKFDIGCLSKTMITLAAMANLGPKARGYVVVGVADKVADVERLETIANVKHRVYNSFFVTGIAHEADALGKTLEQYFHYVVERVKHEPVSANLKQHILSSIRLVRYFDKSLIVFEAEGQREPSVYDNRYYMRYGSQNNELQGEHLAPLFARFFRHGH